MTELVRKVNSTCDQASRNLQILEHEGVVETHCLGRLRMIKLDENNSKTITLLRVLKLLKS